MKKIQKPDGVEYALYYEQYIEPLSKDLNVLDALKLGSKEITQLYKSLSQEQLLYRYAEGKWNMKDILMHLVDVERVFVYRAMRFARRDRTPLPFFDENEFAKNANASTIPLSKLLREYISNRTATLSFFNNLNSKQLKETGIASQAAMSVRACTWIIYGHEQHHLKIIHERYLSGAATKNSTSLFLS